MRSKRRIQEFISGCICLLIIVNFLFLHSTKVYAEDIVKASTVVNYANSLVGKTNATYAGKCLQFCFKGVYNAIGASNAKVGNGGACCAKVAGDKLIVSSSRNDIPLGSLVFFKGVSSQGKCSCGAYYGHVGIYVGSDYIVSARSSGAIKKEKISDWVSWGYAYRGYGYPNGVTILSEVAPVADTVAPVISEVQVSDATKDGYRVRCKVTDNVGVDRVQFPTWTVQNAQDDIDTDWFTSTKSRGTKSGDYYEFYVSVNDHNGEEGAYTTHIYAFDKAGNQAVLTMGDVYVDRTAPVISNVQINDVTKDGYKVQCTVTDSAGVDRVQFPTWTVQNAQDDIDADWFTSAKSRGTKRGDYYEFYVSVNDHNGEEGNYTTHIYAFDKAGNQASLGLADVYIDKTLPVISDVKIINVDATGFTIQCKATDNYEIGKVQFGVWYEGGSIANNWQALSKCSGTKNENIYSYRVNVADYNNKAGQYYCWIAAFDKHMNSVIDKSLKVNVPVVSGGMTSTSKPTVMPTKTPSNGSDVGKNEAISVSKLTNSIGIKKGKKEKVSKYFKVSDKSKVKKITYKVSNSKIATVRSNGTVTAKKKGITKISVMITLEDKTIKKLSYTLKVK